ncbi:MAG: hypothetical protein QXJ45_06935 [Thermoproteota archaeon]
MNPYRKGYVFEQRVRRYFEKHDYYVIRSSHSRGAFDIIAIGKKVYGVQCKTNGYLSLNDRQKLIELGKRYNIIPLLAYRMGKDMVLVDLRTNDRFKLE